MPLQTSNVLNPSEAVARIRAIASGARSQAQSYLATLQAGPVESDWIYSFLTQIREGFIVNMTAIVSVPGLDAYATAQGYNGTISSDVNAAVAAAQACINWVVTNFPKDSTNTWILSEKLNADGTRTPRAFTTAQTAGLQTALTNFIASMS